MRYYVTATGRHTVRGNVTINMLWWSDHEVKDTLADKELMKGKALRAIRAEYHLEAISDIRILSIVAIRGNVYILTVNDIEGKGKSSGT